MTNKLKLVKTKRGYMDGTNTEYTYGDRVFLVERSHHKYFIYEKPRINANQQIWEYNYWDRFPTVIKKFKELLYTGKL